MESQTSSAQIKINGEERSFASPASVADLVRALGLDSTKVAVELNLEIVPRSVYEKTMVKEGDRLEIVQFIGGG